MANLAEAVTADETDWIISADLDDDIDYLTVEDEIVHVTANFPAQYQAPEGTTSAPRIRVERGAGGTTAASHADGTALTPLIPPAAAGGGGAIAATDTQVVFMAGTDAVGSVNLTWDDTSKVLGMAADTDDQAVIRALGIGAELVLEAADGGATNPGGEITLQSGGSVGNDGGQILIITGGDEDGGDSGALKLQTGPSPDGSGGDIDIRANPDGAGGGGSINIVAGTGDTSSGGSVIIQAGLKQAGGSHGTVQIYSADGVHALDLSVAAGFQFLGGKVTLDGLPTADPVSAGQLWIDTAAGRVLKVSAG